MLRPRRVGAATATTLRYEVRINTAKLLMEIQQHPTALQVLEALLEEDNEVVRYRAAFEPSGGR